MATAGPFRPECYLPYLIEKNALMDYFSSQSLAPHEIRTVLTESGDQKEANYQEKESSNDKLRVPVSET